MAYARAHPNMTAGYGSGASQISIGQLQTRGGMSVIAASYRGVPQAVTDLIGGVIDLAFADFSLAIPQMQGGTLRGSSDNLGCNGQSPDRFDRWHLCLY